MEQLQLAHQIEALQQQQQHIALTHQQYVMGGQIPQQYLAAGNFQMPGQMANLSPQVNNFQFPQQMNQQLAIPMNAPQASAHRRNQSALPNIGMGGPPPAPSSGASGFGDFGGQQGGQGRENINPRGRGGGSAGSGHTRRHSLAIADAKKAAELAEQKRKTSGFQFPLPSAGASGDNRESSPSRANSSSGDQATPSARGRGHGRSQSMAVGRGGGLAPRGGGNFQFPAPQTGDSTASQSGQSDFQRRGSGHGRNSSRNFDSNWRQPQQQPAQDAQTQNMGNFNMNQTANAPPFQPGHRSRGSVNQSMGSIGNFQYQPQPQLMQLPQGFVPQMFGTQGLSQLNPLQIAHLQALQAAQIGGQGMGGLGSSQHAPNQMGMQPQQQQRKTLFTPYLPQATLPALLSDGQLVAGILRVNKKNRSDAYVTTTDLDADIFICGSKDRNRALEGDLVAVELLDVDEVWGQKREKEEKKKRKDNADPRGGSIAVNDATTQPESSAAGEPGIRRRGSLRQRPTQKKNDDVEVEGQSLLLMEEEEINDEQKPLYAGHIVAVIERIAGQMFSG